MTEDVRRNVPVTEIATNRETGLGIGNGHGCVIAHWFRDGVRVWEHHMTPDEAEGVARMLIEEAAHARESLS